jgi:hypothetical protein
MTAHLLTFILLLLGQAASPAKETSVITLQASGETKLGIPGFSFVDTAQCDDSGNMFFLTQDSSEGTQIFKLSPDGSKFDYIVDKLDEPFAFIGFRVGSHGEVLNLYQTEKAVYLSRRRQGQNNPTRTKLDLPAHIHPQQFAVFPSGSVLLSGYYGKEAKKAEMGRKYLAVFGPDGRLRRNLKADTGEVEIDKLTTTLPEGSATIGQDGFAYFLGTNVVKVVSENGDLIHGFKFDRPEGFQPIRLGVSGGYLMIDFRTSTLGKAVESRYLVMNASNGLDRRWYKPGDGLGNNLMCFAADQGLTFFRVEGGRLKLVRATLQ